MSTTALASHYAKCSQVFTDSGDSVNTVSKTDMLTPKPQLRTMTIKIFPYGSDTALPIGVQFNCNIQASCNTQHFETRQCSSK